MQVLTHAQSGKNLAALRYVSDSAAGTEMGRLALDRTAAELDRAIPGRQQPDDRLEQGRLAHSVVTEDPDAFALRDGERDPFEHLDAPISGREPFDLDHEVTALPR
jgi:hypothetical protein